MENAREETSWRLRLGLLCVSAILAVCVFYFWSYYSGVVSQRAVRQVEAVGGTVESGLMVGYTFKSGRTTTSLDSMAEGAMHRNRLFATSDEIYFVDLTDCKMNDSDAAIIRRLPNCTILSLRNASLPTTALLEMVAMQSLEVVDLRGLAVNKEVLVVLEGHRTLRALILSADRTDASAIAEFKTRMPSCEVTLDSEWTTPPNAGT